jgi:Polysaccharide biosynthesis/export protein
VRATPILAVLLAIGCGTSAAPPTLPTYRATPPVEQPLASDDVIDIQVDGQPDLSGLFRLAPSGEIDFPLVGRVHLTGLRPGTVESLIADKLCDGGVVKRPSVRVQVRERQFLRGAPLNPTPPRTPRQPPPTPAPDQPPSSPTTPLAQASSAPWKYAELHPTTPE